MIEPIRGQLGVFDVSCSGCGVVERFEDLRFGQTILRMSYGQVLSRMKWKGWGREGGKHFCPDCEFERSPEELERIFGIEIDRGVGAA